MECFGHGKAIRVVLNLNFPVEDPLQVGLYRLAVHADGIGIFLQPGSRRDGSGRPHAERVGRIPDVGGQFIVQPLDAVENVPVAVFLLGIHALAEKLLAGGVQDNAFNLGAAEVNADAKHVQGYRNDDRRFKHATPPNPGQNRADARPNRYDPMQSAR